MKRHHKLLLAGIILFAAAWVAWSMLTVEADLETGAPPPAASEGR